ETPVTLGSPRMSAISKAAVAGEAHPVVFEASGVRFELDLAAPLEFRHDGDRPRLLFTFDATQGAGAFQDAPVRGVSCPAGSFVLMAPGLRAHVRRTTPMELLTL